MTILNILALAVSAAVQPTAETLIRQRVEDFAHAIRNRNLDAVMSQYAPDVVSFDLEPPVSYAGIDNKRRAWQAFFAAHEGAIQYDITQLEVVADGGVAFARSINRVNGRPVRWTACFRRSGDKWRIVHDHVSVPVDPRTLR